MKMERDFKPLSIESPIINSSSANFRLPSWPPPEDFPVTIDSTGKIISRYGDPIWDLTPWASKSLRLFFGETKTRKDDPQLSPANAVLARQIAAWWLWGSQAVSSAETLKHRFGKLSPLFKLCSRENILISDLWRYPKVSEKLPHEFSPGSAETAFILLHSLFEHRDIIGFTILDRECLRRFEAALPEHHSRQTPYIPPRIWEYQVNRLRTFLDEFHEHRKQLEACYHYCLNGYSNYYGSLSEACKPVNIRRPLQQKDQLNNRKTRIKMFADVESGESFSDVADKFYIHNLLKKWLLKPGESINSAGRSISTLANYFTLVGKVGLAYILNFSMMRIKEAWSLHTDCLKIETDERFGTFYVLHGVTTKTVKDDDACWITSPSVQIAIEAMACVARLRMIPGEANENTPITAEYLRNPHLITRHYEPWSGAKNTNKPTSVRPLYPSYQSVISEYPKLFDEAELKITESDLQIAKLITPTLDNNIFSVGKTWPLAWHQLRRTGAVNMQASGLVSDPSLQYQLKHSTRAQSLYYGQGYSKIKFNTEARNEYLRTMYEVIGKEIAQLFTSRFVSPFGESHKLEILHLVGQSDASKLAEAAKAGKVAWRGTFLGGCAKRGPCEYGGIDNISRCGGGDGRPPCSEALFDREKEQSINKLLDLIALRLKDAPAGSPYYESLKSQQIAAEHALNAILNK